MVQNNKVLTVSYGTFSCTLEGFEDSFGTMKVIAEYFRDLAADDRYFGAEPPQPDADMLARIAQREIARQVQASTSDQGVHLRAATLDAPTAAEPVIEEPAVETADTQAVPADETHIVTADEVTPTEAEPVDDLQVAETIEADPVAVAVEQAENDPAPVEEDSAETAPETFEMAEVTEPAQETTEAEHEEENALSDIPDDASDFFADSTPDEQFVDLAETHDVDSAVAQMVSQVRQAEAEDIAAEEAEKPRQQAESIASKLQRIRSVVSRTPLKNPPLEDIAEEDIVEERVQDVAADEVSDTDTDPFDDPIEKALRKLDAKRESQQALEAEADSAPAEQTATENAQPKRRRRLIRVKRAAVDEAVSNGTLNEAPQTQEQTAEPLSEPAPAPKAEPTPVPGAEFSTLSEEDEEDLRRELAEVEADLLSASQPDEVEAQTADSVEEPPTEAETAPAISRDQPTTESDVSRLMDAADEMLGNPETSSSRETYSHMRAAVAAAQDDDTTGTAAEDEEEVYRKDLASVVQPRRPVAKRRDTPRALEGESRPAPLKLVAEQRITDEDEAAQSAAPVRPRRIRSGMMTQGASAQASPSAFADYARDAGAVELHELLEAAASYLSFVEGHEVFSRPDLMNKLRASGSEFNREDGLRSFGQLLREGKIARAANGRFSAAETIGFQPGSAAG
ncbi:chemotaxis protein CheA [Epibacterium ulvae]|uniref:chemotaxis protein CheA n=1 Tax=Epibacterium ulvae TaxID=1156985 RepID=UPI0024938BD3|nr:chemotaxis protein CheA [Epibacterium ulvae]